MNTNTELYNNIVNQYQKDIALLIEAAGKDYIHFLSDVFILTKNHGNISPNVKRLAAIFICDGEIDYIATETESLKVEDIYSANWADILQQTQKHLSKRALDPSIAIERILAAPTPEECKPYENHYQEYKEFLTLIRDYSLDEIKNLPQISTWGENEASVRIRYKNIGGTIVLGEQPFIAPCFDCYDKYGDFDDYALKGEKIYLKSVSLEDILKQVRQHLVILADELDGGTLNYIRDRFDGDIIEDNDFFISVDSDVNPNVKCMINILKIDDGDILKLSGECDIYYNGNLIKSKYKAGEDTTIFKSARLLFYLNNEQRAILEKLKSVINEMNAANMLAILNIGTENLAIVNKPKDEQWRCGYQCDEKAENFFDIIPDEQQINSSNIWGASEEWEVQIR